MSPVSPVFNPVVTVRIGLKNVLRVRASIRSTILDDHVLKAERQNSNFLSVQLKLDKDFTLLPQFPPKLVVDQF